VSSLPSPCFSWQPDTDKCTSAPWVVSGVAQHILAIGQRGTGAGRADPKDLYGAYSEGLGRADPKDLSKANLKAQERAKRGAGGEDHPLR
jgi:hypothetical protein